MLVAGIDVGARNTGVVILRDGNILSHCVVSSGIEVTTSREVVEEALKKTGFKFSDLQSVVATGCGRSSVPFANHQSTEVVCQARGTFWLFPSTRTVINLGAESSQAIKVSNTGRAEAFARNDRCAAGSGLFLEEMSRLLEVPLELMGELSLKAGGCEEVSSICAVFAESEVISHIHRGVPKEYILAGLHKSVITKILEIAAKVEIKSDVIVTGGVAKNIAIIKELENRLGLKIIVPPEPQIVGALGAALYTRDITNH
ncbi:MAG: acyl-CoA dehydratase activase [Chloroflexota bacterium]